MVKLLQEDLIKLGYGDIVGELDGIEGAKTIKAVRQFQEDNELVIDGIAGPKTKKAIEMWKTKVGLYGTRNFTIKEFRSPDTNSLPKEGMCPKLLMGLEFLRWRLGNRPMVINSGYRTKEFNKRVGGISNSNHLKGLAADIVVKGVAASEVHKQAVHIFNGVGKYKNFTHVDTAMARVHFTGKY